MFHLVVPPVEPPVEAVQGTTGPDTISGETGQTVNAGAGADTLSVAQNASDVILNGNRGNDTFDLSANVTSTGTTINDGGGGDSITSGQNHSDLTINGEEGDDNIRFESRSGAISGGDGNDLISVGY